MDGYKLLIRWWVNHVTGHYDYDDDDDDDCN